MTAAPGRLFSLLLALTLLAFPLPGQVGNKDTPDPQATTAPDSQTPLSPTVTVLQGEEGAGESEPAAPLLAPSLWRGYVVLDQNAAGRYLLYGSSVTQGYGLSPVVSGGDSEGPMSMLDPYVGVQSNARRTQFAVQYSPTISLYDSRRWDGTTFHRFRFDLATQLSPRWDWRISVANSYGVEGIRLMSPIALSGGPGSTDLSVMAIQSLTDKMLSVTSSTALNWRRTPRQHWAIQASQYHYSRTLQDQNSNSVSGRFELTQDVATLSKVSTFAQVNHNVGLGCTEYSAGVGFSTHVQKAALRVEGGPEYSTRSCGLRLGGNFAGSLTRQLTPKTALSINGRRDLSSAYVPGSRWVDRVFLGYSQRISMQTSFELDAGYLHSTGLTKLMGRYQGYFFSPQIRWQPARNWGVVGTYRQFQNSTVQGGASGINRRWIMLSVQWHPEGTSKS